MLKERTEKILGAFISCLAICVSVIGLFYSDGGASFQVNNIYGQPVVLYGKGIYANNSLMTVAGRLLSFIVMCLFALLYLYKSIRLLRWSSDYTQK